MKIKLALSAHDAFSYYFYFLAYNLPVFAQFSLIEKYIINLLLIYIYFPINLFV